ncbi:Gibberellic acid methyltransferase 2 [Apostasia shenzhenica]|uniref:Gibberellic acid methyltransferase 2 n=1 Tax=Apostasia shenzhenica TaxID=1088818 RepID=A0A2I0AXP3_9ASPA|nr:Gibberellic acid methyltransferase 2 [Apostasia shenzhenica]
MDTPRAMELISIRASLELKERRLISNNGKSQSRQRELHRFFCMQGGDTDASYAKNSEATACAIALSKPLLRESIASMKLHVGELSIRIADLGCATGYNTISTIEFVVESLRKRYEEELNHVPEFEAFFSDLPSNDFNSLFQLLLLPPFDISQRPYYVAGVPGSFYGRLFPSRKLHLTVSLNSLHWLSRIPEPVMDRKSAAWNRGRVWIDGAKEEVVDAFAKQSAEDLERFLRCRMDETVEGGVLFLLMAGRPSSQRPENQLNDEDTRTKHPFTIIDQAWEDLVKEGSIEEETRDTFNIPAYMRSTEEVKKAFVKCKGFEIRSIEYLKLIENSKERLEDWVEDPGSYGRAKTNLAQAGLRPLIEAHLGMMFTEKLFKKFEKRVSEDLSLIQSTCFYGLIVVSAIRK